MESYFHVVHVRKTCVTAYLNLRTESQKCGKLHDFWEEVVMVYIDIVVLDQFVARRTSLRVSGFFFLNSTRWHEEGGIIHLNTTIIVWYISGLENQRFKLWCYHWRVTRQTKHNYFKLLCKKLRENGKLLVDELRNRSGNVSKSTNSIVWGSWSTTLQHSSMLYNCHL